MSWKRTKAKKALIKIFPIVSGQSLFFYKEIKDKIYLRCIFEWKTIDKKDFNKYLDPIPTDTKAAEITPELSHYLDEILKKFIKSENEK